MLLQDLRYAVRQLRKSPGFAIVVVLMLALGIGANTAVFSVMNAILLQWLPVSHPEGLTYVRTAKPYGQPPNTDSSGDASRTFQMPVFQALRQRTDVFDELVGYVPLAFSGTVAVRQGAVPEEASGDEVTGNFFSGVGVRIQAGRGFSMEDENSHASLAVISYDYWTRRFARDPNVLGQTLYVRGIPMTIVGITARGFKGVEPASATDFWIPLQTRPELNAWGTPVIYQSLYGTPKWCALMMMARLKPGVTPAQAQQALAGTFGEVVTRTVGDFKATQWRPMLAFEPARGISGYNDEYRQPVRILMGLVALVLLIACSNVALMLQSRNVVRQREFSLRLAIGANKRVLFRQLLTESLLLVIAGAGLGWAFALGATQALATWSDIQTGLTPDGRVLLFTLGISVVAALVFGLVPLWTAMRAPVGAVLRSTSQTTTASASRMLGGRIVLVGQMALCLVLLMAAGLLLRTLRNYASVDLGMDTHGLLVFAVTPQENADSHLFYRNLLERLAQFPGVEAVSMASMRPGTDWSNNNDVTLDGVEHKDVNLRSNDVGPNFFHTMGVPILAGRDIQWSDVEAKDHRTGVCLVNETFAKRFFPNSTPIGHVLGGGVKVTIVGVVRDSKYVGVSEEPRPMAYNAVMQAPTLGTMHIELRTHGDAMAILPGLRRTMAEWLPDIPLQQPISQQEQFDNSYREQRMFAAMGGFFGLLSVLLVATGLYGTHSFRVSRRTSEIGVRMALGASRGQVLLMVMRESLWVLLAGVGVGIPLALFAVRPLKAMLYKMSPLDPVSLALALGIMVLVSAIAALVPARRAASVDPIQALRTE